MKRYLISGLLVVGLVVGGLAPRASAQVEDVEVIVGNLPTAGSTLVAGLQSALDVLTSTQSAVDTSAALGDALVATGTDLVAGAPQFGALGLGFTLINLSVQQTLEPVLVLVDDQAPIFDALDDPSMIGDVFSSDDIAQILENLPNVPPTAGNGAIDTVVETLQGNLTGGLFCGASTVGSGLGTLTGTASDLLNGTNYATAATTLLITSIVVCGASDGVLADIETDYAVPFAESAAELTAPLIELLEGITL